MSEFNPGTTNTSLTSGWMGYSLTLYLWYRPRVTLTSKLYHQSLGSKSTYHFRTEPGHHYPRYSRYKHATAFTDSRKTSRYSLGSFEPFCSSCRRKACYGRLCRWFVSCSGREARLQRTLECTTKAGKNQTEFERARICHRMLPWHYPRNLKYNAFHNKGSR